MTLREECGSHMPDDVLLTNLKWPLDPLREPPMDRVGEGIPHDPHGGGRAEKEQIGGDVERLLTDLADLLRSQTRTSPGAHDPRELDFIRAELAEFRRLLDISTRPVFASLIEQLAGLREEVLSLRRRIALRASGSAVELTEEQFQRVVVALESRLGGRVRRGRRTRAQ